MIENVKGTKDFFPDEQVLREQVKDKLVKIFRKFGFNPLETPILNYFEVLASKYAGGNEILKETYRLKDQGGRDIGLRYDLTVPLAKAVGLNPNLKMPFKRYEISKVFRDGPVKSGRMREFTQCDVDMVGTGSMIEDAEIIALTMEAFNELGFENEVIMEVNNRKLLSGLILDSGMAEEKLNEAITSIDKLKKIGRNGVEKELREKKINEKAFSKLFDLLETNGTPDQIISTLEKKLSKNKLALEGLKELKELFEYLRSMDALKDVQLATYLARGLDIYTGPVFEVYLKNSAEFSSSLAGGGRYDKIIGGFLGGTKNYPATGISFGLEPITVVQKMMEKSIPQTFVKVFVIPIRTEKESFKILSELRKNGINSDMDFSQKSISKNFEFADKQKIPFALMVGENELKSGKFSLKNMNSGEEQKLSLEEVIAQLKE